MNNREHWSTEDAIINSLREDEQRRKVKKLKIYWGTKILQILILALMFFIGFQIGYLIEKGG